MSEEKAESTPEVFRVEGKKFDDYQKYLREEHRPPSRGGNTKALHSHVLTIDGEKYSFLAHGACQWAFKSDTVSFDYVITKGKWRNILSETFVARDKDGEPVLRGRKPPKKRRTAPPRMPGSRRERRD